MGFMLDDNGKGIHAEALPDSFVIFTDSGKMIEVEWSALPELEFLVHQLYVLAGEAGITTL